MNKLIYRLFNKIGQNSLPTAEVTKTNTVSGSPPNFIASNYYPSIIIAFNSRNTSIINGLSNIINQALYYNSNGKIHLPWMYNMNFNFDSSIAPSVDLKNIMNFSKNMYQQLFSNLNKPLSINEIYQRVLALKNSSALVNLPGTSTSSQLYTKIGGDLKTLINNYLLQIK